MIHARYSSNAADEYEIRIRVMVLPGKRLILKHEKGEDRVSVPPGELHGFVRYDHGMPWTYFPTASGKLELSELKKRWDNEVIDAWQQTDDSFEEELFA